jgi:hypothetical protein
MSHILIAWEIGGYYGHFGTQLPIACALRDAGHKVLFTTPDCKVGAQVLVSRAFPFVQAPGLTTPVTVDSPPGTYAELLIAEGYADYEALCGRVMAWLQLFELWRPALVLCDHAPTVLLAARVAAIPSIQVGHGFFIPPAVTPLPGIRTWEPPVAKDRAEHSEALVLHTINRVLAQTGAARKMDSLADLYTAGDRVLTTFAELDHFEGRVGDSYAGALYGRVAGVQLATTLEVNNGANIFAYIHNNVPGLRTLLEILSALDSRTLCIVPQMDPGECDRLSTGNLIVSSQLRSLDQSLAALDLVICGGIGTAAQSLLAGVPVFMMPANLEQYLLGLRVEAIGVGVCVGPDRSAAVISSRLEQALKDPRYRATARRFAERYRDFDPLSVVKHVVGLVHRRLAERETRSPH